MGVRQQRKERRAKAEIEVKQAFLDSLDYIGKRGKDWTLRELREMAEVKVSEDTKLRFKGMIDYQFRRVVEYTEREQEMKGGEE